ncbi:MAG: phosphoribosylformylglycinamidine synthase subunit PurS [Candidatus Freyarchaeota archaeon]|nr:phosphoribosylformylglycinamidine synthase subunit PurS [Candidatus Jordarchaeia archaeon]MBS7269918.1 phosphoribosylformylglycinamidine synthase subunit PurS [Candidatus Jordarchaeia archaeon]MBS7280576.1 phosphoribosylformylglycinamidine synthase subunit PurS [Candidatus Jordarchaeia archaeon]
MNSYTLEVIIENKPAARDPEGETILKDLINQNGFEMVKSVRSGKYLRINLEAESKEEAKSIVYRMCNDLRIYNPVIHIVSINVKD